MGQWRNGIHRNAARPAGRRRRRVGVLSRRADDRRGISTGAASAAGPHRPRAGVAHPGGARTAGVRHGRASRMALVGDQVRRARPRPRAAAHAGSAACRRVAAHPVVGVSSRQRRPRTRPHDRRLRAARRLAGAAGHRHAPAAGPQGADVAAGRGGVDRRRDRAACVRRRRRAVGRRLPPRQDGRLGLAGPAHRRRRDGGAARADAPASPPCGPATGGQRAGPTSADERSTGDPEFARDL